ncbi:MAG: thioredoxin domain-containing protein [Chloroflexota bacterium]|nr:thioredoxin domain-containing protein [Chloroflexota bacterium]
MKPKQNQLTIVFGVIFVAVIAVGVVIAASGSISGANIDYTAMPKSRAADGAFVLGNPDAPITIIEFADYGCPHCQEYHPEISRFIKDFVETGKANFEYRTFPTAGGARTVFAGQIGECIDDQQPGAFWDAYKIFYDLAVTARYNDEASRLVAQQLNLSYSDLLECAADAQQVNIDVRVGQQYGVSGTPAVMMRLGDSAPQWITYNGVTYNRGPVAYDVLAAVTNSYNAS